MYILTESGNFLAIGLISRQNNRQAHKPFLDPYEINTEPPPVLNSMYEHI